MLLHVFAFALFCLVLFCSLSLPWLRAFAAWVFVSTVSNLTFPFPPACLQRR